MPRGKREMPTRLPEKLKKIRLDSGLFQHQMRWIIQPNSKKDHSNPPISEYEIGRRAPSLMEILRYARHGGVTIESILDDEKELEKINQIHE